MKDSQVHCGEQMGPFRILVVGAGFSRAAGLPLGRDLLRLVLEEARSKDGANNAIESDLAEFRAYRARCEGVELGREDVDLEEFVGFLDVEHALRLSGSDTLTQDGNGSQLAIRRYIGVVLQKRTPTRMDLVPSVYRDLASRLHPTDTIITFNYDILLERLLEHQRLPYRLFPNRFLEVHPTHCTVDNSKDDLLLLKLHGSVDWFYRRQFDLGCEVLRATGNPGEPRSALFGERARFKVTPLVDGPRPAGEELSRMFRVDDPDRFYRELPSWEAPYLLAPSSVKALYVSPLRELWDGLGRVGGLNFGLSIVGFSLPSHDEYLRQMLYRIARNFQYFEPNHTAGGRTKAKVVLVDRQDSAAGVAALKRRYGFLDWSRTEVYCEGLDGKAVDLMLGAHEPPAREEHVSRKGRR